MEEERVEVTKTEVKTLDVPFTGCEFLCVTILIFIFRFCIYKKTKMKTKPLGVFRALNGRMCK